MADQGVVTFFNSSKGYGWISPSEGSDDVFFHVSDVLDSLQDLSKGELVEYIIEEGQRGPKATQVRSIDERLRGVVISFGGGHGRIEYFDQNGSKRSVFVHFSGILGSGFRTLEIGEEVDFSIEQGDRGLRAVRVVADNRLPLERFAALPNFDAELEKLVNLAYNENWDYRYTRSKQKYPILRSYIHYTFARLDEEGKIASTSTSSGEQIACFNTGLVTEMQEEIFALFVNNTGTQTYEQEWILKGFFRESDRNLTHFGKRPDIANYFQEPSELLYDSRVELVVNVPHIIQEDQNQNRFPTEFQGNTFALKGVLDGAIAAAKNRVRRNYKTAVPQFHRGRLQLLLPLCLRTPKRADLALVVARENEVYRGSTVLTLDMAYNNARLIARPDNEWLDP